MKNYININEILERNLDLDSSKSRLDFTSSHLGLNLG